MNASFTSYFIIGNDSMNVNYRPKRRLTWLAYLGAAVVFFVGLEFVFDFFPEKEKELRSGLRSAVEKTFPQEAADVARSFGLSSYGLDSEVSQSMDSAAPSIVLIHGLDDPGKVWMNLAPGLEAKGLNVWEIRYPNDQPVVDSARFFNDELTDLKARGISQIIIVAHSMGGLVSREMLTSPHIAYSAKVRTGAAPRVAGLIMVGTPNHGSQLARFRLFSEIRDQWIHMVKGKGHLLRGILDGAGEAKIDLLPESLFLNMLNARPHPEGVKMLIIAGIASPWDGKDIDRFIDSAQEHVPASEQKTLRDFRAFLESMTDGLGDGLVTVESTRLEGIEHQTVRGTHLSMIRNVMENSSRIPPAIPLIYEYVEQILATQ